jgi:hypothetical protein
MQFATSLFKAVERRVLHLFKIHRKLPPIQGPPLAHREPQNHFFFTAPLFKTLRFEQSLFKTVYEPTRKNNEQAAAFRNNICIEKELVRLRGR